MQKCQFARTARVHHQRHELCGHGTVHRSYLLIAKVRTNLQGTHLKFTVTFKHYEVDVTAEAYKWRKTPFNRHAL